MSASVIVILPLGPDDSHPPSAGIRDDLRDPISHAGARLSARAAAQRHRVVRPRPATNSTLQRVMPDTRSWPLAAPSIPAAPGCCGRRGIAVRPRNGARHRIRSRVRTAQGAIERHDAGRTRHVRASAPARRRGARDTRASRPIQPDRRGRHVIGAAVAKETVNSIAGHPVRDTPFATVVVAP